jgi:hypothetical protein
MSPQLQGATRFASGLHLRKAFLARHEVHPETDRHRNGIDRRTKPLMSPAGTIYMLSSRIALSVSLHIEPYHRVPLTIPTATLSRPLEMRVLTSIHTVAGNSISLICGAAATRVQGRLDTQWFGRRASVAAWAVEACSQCLLPFRPT